MMSTRQWPERFPVDYIINFLEYDPCSPTGLTWRNSPNRWAPKGAPAGTKMTSGWFVTLMGKVYNCAHIILMLNNQFSKPGQICWHIDSDVFNNRLENLKWTSRSDRQYRKAVSKNISTASRSLTMERNNIHDLREWLEVDSTSPSGLRWKKSRQRIKAGAPAGSYNEANNEYRVTLNATTYSNARLVLWLSGFEPEPGQIVRYLNYDKKNLRIENLEWITRSEMARQNGQMTSIRLKHVVMIDGRFWARYKIGKQTIQVGVYDDPWEASQAAIAHQSRQYEQAQK